VTTADRPADPSPDQRVLSVLLAKDAVRDTIQRYCRAVDRRDWALLESVYHDGAYDDHGPYKGDVPGFIAWVRLRHEQIAMSMHVVTNCMIEIVDDEHAVAETYCVAMQRSVAGINPWSADADAPVAEDAVFEMRALCRYLDQIDRRGERWAIAHRVVACEDNWVSQRTSGVIFPAGAVLSARSRADYLYELFSSDTS
jgi:hypothetical protein